MESPRETASGRAAWVVGGAHAAAAAWLAAGALACQGGPSAAALLAAAACWCAAVARAVWLQRRVLVEQFAGCGEEEWPAERQQHGGEAALVEGCVDEQDARVGEQEFERSLEEFASSLACERAAMRDRGLVRLYGPVAGNISYEIGRESLVFLGSLRASLLQMAHPFVALGVEEHSNLRRSPQERFYRTFKYVFAITFGCDKDVVRAARAVRALHDRVEGRFAETVGPYRAGTPYSAHQPHALLWVAATLTDSAMLAFELVVRALSADEKDRAYAGFGRFLRVFGVPARVVPRTHAAFREYCRRMWHSRALTIGPDAASLHRFLVSAPRPYLAPLMWWIDATTAVVMPPRLARGFGMRAGFAAHLAFFATYAPLRVFYSLLPGCVRYLSRYLEIEREAGVVRRARWPSRVSAAFARWIIRVAIDGGGEKRGKAE